MDFLANYSFTKRLHKIRLKKNSVSSTRLATDCLKSFKILLANILYKTQTCKMISLQDTPQNLSILFLQILALLNVFYTRKPFALIQKVFNFWKKSLFLSSTSFVCNNSVATFSYHLQEVFLEVKTYYGMILN